VLANTALKGIENLFIALMFFLQVLVAEKYSELIGENFRFDFRGGFIFLIWSLQRREQEKLTDVQMLSLHVKKRCRLYKILTLSLLSDYVFFLLNGVFRAYQGITC
jgi:hypothetical protein